MENNLIDSAQTDGAEIKAECSESTEILILARKIDSSLNPRTKTLLKDVALWNPILEVLNNENLVPVGSSQDGSKANVLGDSGDVDILLISKNVVLEESLLEYDIKYPAFLRVPGDGNHLKLFKWKRLVENKYVPVNILKNLDRRIYGLVRFVVSLICRPGISADGKYFIFFKESAVGFEIAALEGPSTMLALHMAQSQEQIVNKWDVVLKLSHCILDSLTALVHKCDPHASCISQSQKSFSTVEEGVTIAGHKLADLLKWKNDNKGKLKMKAQIEKRETKTDPIYRNSASLKKDASETSKFHKFMTADIVPAFTIQGWPRVAKEWITRTRKWPSNNLVHDIVQTGCQIVAKRPLYPELNGDRHNEDHSPEADENDTWFRLSFAQCEHVLAKQLTEVPVLCWKILKAYQKAFLSTEPPVLTSYHWKTVLLWIREETDDDFWSEGNLLNCVIMALDFMRNCLEKRFLPLYFVREENLIAGCRDEKVIVTIDKINKILQEPSKNLSYVLDIVNCSNSVYESSEEKIKDHLSAESHENMIEDLCENVIHGGFLQCMNFWKTQSIAINIDDSLKRYCDKFRHCMQIMMGMKIKPSTRRVFTRCKLFMEKMFKMMEDKDSSESDSENDQVLFSSEQSTNYTTQRESMIGYMPSKANEHIDQTRKNNDSSTVQAQQNPRRNEITIHARDKNLGTVNKDVERVSDPQRVEEISNYQISNAEIIHTSTRQKDSSFSQIFIDIMEVLQIFLRHVSAEKVQDSDDVKHEFDSDLFNFALLLLKTLINRINKTNESSRTQLKTLINRINTTNESSRTPCDFDLD
ncbi:hypothetical protein DPMN_065012 [Dreissena polymorpha]|uniref:Mab-21-like HhH/H2TH-like domain-containing protein n=1 Tax=Dreissena polymorpha TaxID=45954 RepID=A0A9D4CDA9_DREPO|nr:hypothetical protein DPMN_065012 [Dreissena polymorpha]